MATGPKQALRGSSGHGSSRIMPSLSRSVGMSSVVITVPGAVHSWGAAHRRFGRLDWADLLAPAIDLASGFPALGGSENADLWKKVVALTVIRLRDLFAVVMLFGIYSLLSAALFDLTRERLFLLLSLLHDRETIERMAGSIHHRG